MFDSETKDSLFLDNHAVNSTGGAGIKAAQTMVDNKANVVITFSCGEKKRRKCIKKQLIFNYIKQ